MKAVATPRIRHAEPGDEAGLRDFLSGLSERSRYLRFFHNQARLDVNAGALARCEQNGGIGLVAQDSSGCIIAHAHLFPSAGGPHEMGIAVSDEHQRLGLGARLLDALGRAARDRSMLAYRAVVLASNEPMLRLLGSIGCVIADSDTEFFDLLVGTGGVMPSWPPSGERRPRVLVEGKGWYSSAESEAVTSLGCETLRCTGRLPAHCCPLISGGTCPLVEEADLVVVAFRSGDPNRAVLEQHLSRPGRASVLAVTTGAAGAGCGGPGVMAVPGPREERQGFLDVVSRVLGLPAATVTSSPETA